MPESPFASTTSVGRVLARVRAWVRWHRRAVAIGLVAWALLLVARDLRPPPAPTVAVVAATHDLDAGTSVSAADTRIARIPASALPDGALRAPPTGRVLALPVRRGEVLTDVRVLDDGLLSALGADLAGSGDVVAAPVHLADASTAVLLRVGDTVDVLGASTSGGTSVVAGAARVLLTPPARASSAFGASASPTGADAVVVLAVRDDEAIALARSAALDRLSVVLRPAVTTSAAALR